MLYSAQACYQEKGMLSKLGMPAVSPDLDQATHETPVVEQQQPMVMLRSCCSLFNLAADTL